MGGLILLPGMCIVGCVMDTGSALLRAICLTPEDDAPRLVYADWLEENGYGDRAEFIRLQIDVHRNPASVCGYRTGARYMRMRYLMHLHWHEWRPVLAAGTASQFARGFVDTVWIDVADFYDKAAEIARVHPVRCWSLKDVTHYGHVLMNWNDDLNHHLTGVIRRSLFDKLTGGHVFNGSSWRFRKYADAQEAGADLERACYAYARTGLTG